MARLDLDFSGTVKVTLTQPTYHGRAWLDVHAGVIDDDVRELFGFAFCHWLAAAVHCLTGWQVVTVDIRDSVRGWMPTHSAVLTPTGAVLDIFGVHRDIPAVQAKYAETHRGCPVRHRIVPVADMPGDVLTDIDHLRGNRMWWMHTMPELLRAVVQHYARLILRTNGYGAHLQSPTCSGLTDCEAA
jgi:hypothetical protein